MKKNGSIAHGAMPKSEKTEEQLSMDKQKKRRVCRYSTKQIPFVNLNFQKMHFAE